MKMVIMTIVWAIRINTVSYFLTPLSNPQLRGLASSPGIVIIVELHAPLRQLLLVGRARGFVPIGSLLTTRDMYAHVVLDFIPNPE